MTNQIFQLVQQITAHSTAQPRLWLVTSAATVLTEGETVDPFATALRALVRVLGHEHPELRATVVDLNDDEDGMEKLRLELAVGSDDREIAWRGGRRYVARLTHQQLPDTEGVRPIRPDGAYIVTGGLGGLGLVLAQWLSDSGAARIVLNGRSAPKPEAVQVIQDLRHAGTKVTVVSGDIAEEGVAAKLVDAAQADGIRLRGVIHGAAVLDDRVAVGVDEANVARVWTPKAVGAWRLHEATLEHDLDFWLGFSSAAALVGSPGQSVYATANSYLDGVCELRNSLGLKACTIRWGTWSQVGLAAQTDLGAVRAIDPHTGILALEQVLSHQLEAAGVLDLDAAGLTEMIPTVLDNPYYERIAVVDTTATDWVGVEQLSIVEPEQAAVMVRERIDHAVCGVMGLHPDTVSRQSPLTTLGMDSLLAVRIRNTVSHDLRLTIPPALLLGGTTLTQLQEWALEELGYDGVHIPEQSTVDNRGPAVTPPRDGAERLVLSAWQEVLGRTVSVTADFYEIGGTDDQALRILDLMSAESGRELDPADVLRHPSIERMAQFVRTSEDTTGGVRVLRAEGTGEPLFLFHPGGGDTTVFRQLVSHLAPGFPVYGFDRIDSVTSVVDRVEQYLPRLLEIRPQGPYRLAGWSFGGFLAYEMGRRLTELGKDVEFVGMIDSIIPLPIPEGTSESDILRLRFERFSEFLETSYGKAVRLPLEDMARMSTEDQVEALITAIRSAGVIDESVSPAILRHQRTSFVDAVALERYEPVHYPAPVRLYSVQELPEGGMRDPRFDRQDAARGWDVPRGDDLEVISVPGHHLSVLDPPHVAVLAAHLSTVLTGKVARV